MGKRKLLVATARYSCYLNPTTKQRTENKMSMPTHCALTRCYTIWPELLVVNETCTGERNSDYRSFRQFEEEIVEGMRKYGVLETLDVFKTTNDSGELVYEVSKGRQRTINVCEANERDRAWYSNNDQELKPEWIKQAPGRNNAEREKNLHVRS